MATADFTCTSCDPATPLEKVPFPIGAAVRVERDGRWEGEPRTTETVSCTCPRCHGVIRWEYQWLPAYCPWCAAEYTSESSFRFHYRRCRKCGTVLNPDADDDGE